MGYKDSAYKDSRSPGEEPGKHKWSSEPLPPRPTKGSTEKTPSLSPEDTLRRNTSHGSPPASRGQGQGGTTDQVPDRRQIASASPPSRPPQTRQLTHTSSLARVSARKEFLRATLQGRHEYYSNPESIPPSNVSFAGFQGMYPKFKDTMVADDIRRAEYEHLEDSGHVCFDYSGFGLFSHRHHELNPASSSFSLAYVTGNLPTHALYGAADEGTVEGYIRKRILDYLNINEADYSMVFTSSRGTAFKLLAESYPFDVSDRLLTAYDHESESVKWMVERAKRQGAKIMTAHFKWPSLRISSEDLKKQMQVQYRFERSNCTKFFQERRKKKDAAKGLFVFPVQSRITGAKYSYQWMSHAQNNKWHVLLDATALGPKDMSSLGLSLFRPDFIISSFYKVFGADPTGFGCLFIKNSAIHALHSSSRARGVGMVRIVPTLVQRTRVPADEGQDERKTRESHRGKMSSDEDGDSDFLPSPHAVPAFSGPVASFYATAESGSLFMEGSSRFTGDDGEFACYQQSLLEKGVNGQYSRTCEREQLDGSPRQYSPEVGCSEIVCASGIVFQSGKVYPASGSLNSANYVVPSESHSMNAKGGQKPHEERSDQPSAIPKVESQLSITNQQEPSSCAPRIRDHPGVDVLEPDEVSFSCDVNEITGTWESTVVRHEGNTPGNSSSFRFPASSFQPETGSARFFNSTTVMDQHSVTSSNRADLGSSTGQPINRLTVLMDANCDTSSHLLEEDHHSNTEAISGEELSQSYREEVSTSKSLKTQVQTSGTEENRGLVSRETERDYALYGLRDEFSHSTLVRALSRELELDGVSDVETCEVGEDVYFQRNLHSKGQMSGGAPQEYYDDEASVFTDEEFEYGYQHGDEGDDDVDDDDEDWEPLVLCCGLDHADSVGLTKTNLRLRLLTNWLVYSLLQLRHPGPQGSVVPLVHVYGPKVKFDRGHSVAFNIFDWSGKLLPAGLVQRLADRSNIGLGLGVLRNLAIVPNGEEVPGLVAKTRKGSTEESRNGSEDAPCIPVVTAGLSFLTNFEDVYRLWHFVAKFLDVDFVAREVWKYHSLNQETVVVGCDRSTTPSIAD